MTATETNNKGFEIQRECGNEWQIVGFLDGKGTTTQPQNYSFSDNVDGLSGTISYRLKQIDYDGSFEYSDVVEVDIISLSEFVLYQNYPNPFNPNTNSLKSVH